MSRLSIAALLVLVAGGLQAQTPPTGAATVRVDFSATVDGASTDDLNADEVQVLEDGVVQPVESFRHVQAGPGAAGSHKVFVVLLDTYNSPVETSTNLRLPLIRFLDRLIGPDDMVALTTPEMAGAPLTFGGKGTVISNIMQPEWTWGRRGRLDERDPKEKLYEACYGSARLGQTTIAAEMIARRREQLTLDALSETVERTGEAGEGRTALLVVSDGWQLFRANPDLASADPGREKPRDVFRRQPRSAPPERSDAGVVNRAECEADRGALSQLDHTQSLRDVAEQANHGNVTVYPIYASGLAAVPGGAAPAQTRPGIVSPRVGQDALRFLADNTDGLAVLTTRDVESGLERIGQDLGSYYLVEYTPTNARLDGRFRAITVRVSRAGARVRNRRGYRGRTANDLLSDAAAGRSKSSDAEGAAATLAVNTRSQFRIRTSAWSRPLASSKPGGGFWIVGEIDYRTRRELEWTSGATAAVTVLASDGTEVDSRTMTVRTEDGPFGVQVPESGGLPAGEYAVRVQLTSDADPSLMLADTARVVVGQPSGLGEAVLWRRGPTTGLEHRRTADPRFQRSERLRLELPSTMQGPAKARLLDRNGGLLNVPLQVTEREEVAGGLRWIVVDGSLAPLAPGDYSIEVTQGTARQVTPFRVIP